MKNQILGTICDNNLFIFLLLKQNGVTMGLARVGGMCTNQHNCVIGELGVTNSMGKPYPSAGFTAIFVMAHEIGHNLGMLHDNSVESFYSTL